MTATHTAVVPEPVKHEPKHAAVKASRFHLPARFAAEARDARKAAKFATEAAKATEKAAAARTALKVVPNASKAIVDTGKATFTVSSAGTVTRNAVKRSAKGYSTFAEHTGSALAETFDTPWWAQLFESAEQRARRVNIQAVAHVLILTASLAGKLAARRAK